MIRHSKVRSMKVSIDDDEDTQEVGVTRKNGNTTKVEVDTATAREFIEAIRGEKE